MCKLHGKLKKKYAQYTEKVIANFIFYENSLIKKI
jgi:hypothetical protein